MHRRPERQIQKDYERVGEKMKDVKRFKCYTCHTIIKEQDLVEILGKRSCPSCGEEYLEEMCPLDHCLCIHDAPMTTIAYCQKCNMPVCPKCGTHDVVQISRVTGYYSDVTGWNAAKKQELRDRVRYNIGAIT